jgi:dTDP-4-dehydrorhamnose 3,5-epimerase
VNLSAGNRKMLWIPAGFAHGFLVLSEAAEVLYKATDFYAPELERTLLWNDPRLKIPWPMAQPVLSDKDQRGSYLAHAEVFD